MARRHATLGHTFFLDPGDTVGEGKQERKVALVSTPKVLETYEGPATTSATTATDLYTFILPANMLRDNGWAIRFETWGRHAATANNKTTLITLGGSTLISAGALAANDKPWHLAATVMRRTAATQSFKAEGVANNAVVTFVSSTLALDLTADLTFAVTTTDATAAGGTILNGVIITLIPQYDATKDGI